MKKKITALILALAMMLGLTQGAFAAEPEEITEEQIQAEIQARTEEVYNLVYAQLESQDALVMLDTYMDIFIPEIEYEVMMKYNDGVVPYSDSRQCYFAYGGMVSYTNALTGVEIVDTYLDYDNSYYYVLSQDTFSVKDIVEIIVGQIPIIGNFTGIICGIQTISDKINKQSILKADGFARVVNAYDPDSETKSSVCIGWETHSMSLSYDSDLCLNFEREFFEKSDPWAENKG